MIYANRRFEASKLEKENGFGYQIVLGTSNREGKLLVLLCKDKIILQEGMNKEYTIKLSTNGEIYVDKEEDNQIFILMTSYKGNQKQEGYGYISVFNRVGKLHVDFSILMKGIGVAIENSKFCYWESVLVMMRQLDCVFRIHYIEEPKCEFDEYFFINGENIKKCTSEEFFIESEKYQDLQEDDFNDEKYSWYIL